MVKVYLSRKGISFEEHNISIDNESLKKLVSLGYRTTPVTIIGGNHVVGYSPSSLDSALNEAGIK